MILPVIPILWNFLLAALPAAIPLDYHVGQTREWLVRGAGFDSSIVRTTILDSARDRDGLLWTMSIERTWAEDSSARDTAVLRIFDLDTVVKGSHLALKNIAVWQRPSCLMPIDLQSHSADEERSVGNLVADRFWSDGRDSIFRRLPGGMTVAACSQDYFPWAMATLDGSGSRCFGFGECEECLGRMSILADSSYGTVRWSDPRYHQSWQLRSVDGAPYSTRPASLSVRPIAGETWVWNDSSSSTRGAMKFDRTWIFRILDELPDSAGATRYRLELTVQSLSETTAPDSLELVIDTIAERVVLAGVAGSPWAWAPSIPSQLALGYLRDWTMSAESLSTRAGVESSLDCWASSGRTSSSSQRIRTGIGAILLEGMSSSWSPVGANSPSDGSSRRKVSLVAHSLAGTARVTESKPSMQARSPHDLPSLRDLILADPTIEVARVLTNGARQTARGHDALRLLSLHGPAIFVVFEGGRPVAIPSARF